MPEEEPVVDPTWGDEPEANEHAKFRNIYIITDTNNNSIPCIFSALNDVIFLRNFTLTNYTGNATFATLPTDLRPTIVAYLPCVISSGNDLAITFITINTNGTMSIPSSHTSAILHTAYHSFNLSPDFFTE